MEFSVCFYDEHNTTAVNSIHSDVFTTLVMRGGGENYCSKN